MIMCILCIFKNIPFSFKLFNSNLKMRLIPVFHLLTVLWSNEMIATV